MEQKDCKLSVTLVLKEQFADVVRADVGDPRTDGQVCDQRLKPLTDILKKYDAAIAEDSWLLNLKALAGGYSDLIDAGMRDLWWHEELQRHFNVFRNDKCPLTGTESENRMIEDLRAQEGKGIVEKVEVQTLRPAGYNWDKNHRAHW